jgi:LPS-assembly lipoprotein
MLRNALRDRFDPNNIGAPTAYQLSVRLEESIAFLALRGDASATRANLTLTATFGLSESASGATVSGGSVRSVNAYDILSTESEFSNRTAQEDARRRAAIDLANQIAIRVSLALDRHTAQATSTP